METCTPVQKEPGSDQSHRIMIMSTFYSLHYPLALSYFQRDTRTKLTLPLVPQHSLTQLLVL